MDLISGKTILYLLTFKSCQTKDIEHNLLEEVGAYELSGEKTIRIWTSLPTNELRDFIVEKFGIEEKGFTLLNTKFPFHKY